jgi:Uma2 family endonuclease
MPEALVAERPAVWTRAVPPTEDTRNTMTYEEFLAWADEDTWAEWVDGEVIEMSPASRLHQGVASFLERILGGYVEIKGLGEVYDAPFQMRTEYAGREPDLLFVSREHLGRFTDQYLDGPADLVVEVISPNSRGRDRGDKFFEYESAGVCEYWIIDPERRQAEFYQRGNDGIYRLAPVREGVYRSAVLEGLWLKVDWLWEYPRPTQLEVFRQWGLL